MTILYVFLILLVIIPYNAQAVCFESFQVVAQAPTIDEVRRALNSAATDSCGSSEWIEQMTKPKYVRVRSADVSVFKASALFKCCSPW